MLRYLKYDNLNIDEELIKINNCKEVELVLEPNNKKCLFILGMLFANGAKIKILNENIESNNKNIKEKEDTIENYKKKILELENEIKNNQNK